MRKTLFAAGAALMLALSVPSVANAQRHWGGGWGGGWHGGWHGFHRGFVGPRFGFHRGFVGPRFGFAFASCSVVRRVWTPFGWRWHRIWVC